MKNERQAKILSLIKEKNIETQEELTSLLLKAGYKVTQATVSRDIKELKIIKITGEKGGYKYASASTDRLGVRAKYKKIIEETVINASYAKNLVVIKTFAGMAQAAGAAIDAIAFPEILGCIAGDDTLIAVANGEEAADQMTAKINDMLHQL